MNKYIHIKPLNLFLFYTTMGRLKGVGAKMQLFCSKMLHMFIMHAPIRIIRLVETDILQSLLFG